MEHPITLYQIHEESGLRPDTVLERMAQYSPDDAPGHVTALYHILRRGTQKNVVMRMLSHAYGKKLEIIEAAAAASRQYGRPPGRQGKGRGKIPV